MVLWILLAAVVILIALESPIGTYDTTLFADHMVQHLLLVMVAAPLLALGAPITLLLRVASPEWRQRVGRLLDRVESAARAGGVLG